MTDRPTDQPTSQQANMMGYRESTLPTTEHQLNTLHFMNCLDFISYNMYRFWIFFQTFFEYFAFEYYSKNKRFHLFLICYAFRSFGIYGICNLHVLWVNIQGYSHSIIKAWLSHLVRIFCWQKTRLTNRLPDQAMVFKHRVCKRRLVRWKMNISPKMS